MKLKTLLTILAVTFASCLYAEEVENIVAVSADGSKITYALADIKRIEVNATYKSGEMTVVKTNKESQSGYTKLLFAHDTPTSIDGIGEVSVYVFPNPVSNTLNIMGVNESASLAVYNLSGKCIIKDKGNTIDVSSLSQGTYILQIDGKYNSYCIISQY